jgi:hypothetical protein
MPHNGDGDWHQIETYKSLIQFGAFGLKFLQVVNGGAVLALLAYLGDVTGAGRSAPDVTYPMILFVAGLALSGAATITVYLTQLALYNEGNRALSDGVHGRWLWLSIGLCGLSLVSFAVGAVWATRVFAG